MPYHMKGSDSCTFIHIIMIILSPPLNILVLYQYYYESRPKAPITL